jgi:hypothetical protein
MDAEDEGILYLTIDSLLLDCLKTIKALQIRLGKISSRAADSWCASIAHFHQYSQIYIHARLPIVLKGII